MLRAANARISDALGVEVHIRDFSLRLSRVTPTLELYDVVVNGAPPYPDPPVLHINRVAIGARIISIFHRKWYLADLVIDHPVLRLLVDANENTNLPKGSRSIKGIFGVGIRRVTLRQGEIYFNDRKNVLDASLRDVELQSSFDAARTKYSGNLSYRDGEIHLQNLSPMLHSLEAEFEATLKQLALKRVTVTTKTSTLSLSATVDDYTHPQISGTYQASLDLVELRQILRDPTLPVGVLKLAGSGRFQNNPERSLLQMLSVEGSVASSAMQFHTAKMHTTVRNVTAQYSLQRGDLDIRTLKAQLFGGAVTGSYAMHDVATTQQSNLHAELQDVALSELETLASPSTPQHFQVDGTGNLTLDATWSKAFNTLVAHVDGNLKGNIAPAGGSRSVPLDGDIDVRYSAAANEVTFAESFFRMPQTLVKLDGKVGKRALLRVQLHSNDLQEVEAAANVFGIAREPLGLFGAASFEGTVQGSTAAPQIAGQFASPMLRIKGTEWRTVRAFIDAAPSHLIVRSGELRTADDAGRVTFNANVTLDQWSYRKTNPLQIDLNATQFSVEDLKRLTGLHAPITGTLSARVSLRGSQLSPVGQATANLTRATVAGEPVQSVRLSLQGNGDEVRGHLGVWMAAGNAQGDVRYFPKQNAYDGQLRATDVRLDQLEMVRSRNIRITGALNLSAKSSGTLDNPALDFTAHAPQLDVENQSLRNVKLQANIANHVANVLLDLDSQALSAFVRGRGTVQLTGDYFADATLDAPSLPLKPLLAIYFPAQAPNLDGQTELRASLKGPLKNPSALDAHISLATLSLTYGNNIQFTAVQPVQLDYRKGVLRLQRTAIRGPYTDLQLQGDFPVGGADSVALLAVGAIDLQIIQMFNPDIRSSGQLRFNVNGYGQRSDPTLQGQITVVDVNVAGDGLPLGLQNGNGVLTVRNDRLEINQFHGNVSNGTLTARGSISYRPSVRFNVAVTANDIRTLFLPGLREGVDTNLTLTGSMQSPLLRGQIRLNELSFAPTFDVAELINAVTGGRVVQSQSGAGNLNLDLTIQSTNELSVSNSMLSVEGSTNIRVRGSAADPTVLGRVNLSGGDLIFRGNRYALLPSTVNFVNPFGIEPRVNLALETRVQGYNVQLQIRGAPDQLRMTYSSEPSLPPADIITLLIFGRTRGPTEGNPALSNIQAESLIASGVSRELTNRIQKTAGISQLSIDPALGGNQQDPGTRVTIQQNVTANLFVKFAADATSTQRQVIQVEYQATPRVAISGVRDQSGGFALEIRVRQTW